MFTSVIRLLSNLLPIRKRSACFFSFTGLYNDNPLYISESLHNADPDCQISWLISDKSKEQNNIPEYVNVMKYNSIRAQIALARSRVVVENYAGIFFGFCKKNQLWLYQFLKNRKQINISTWHGTPLKKIGIDSIKETKNIAFFSTSDLIVCGNRYEKHVFRECFSPRIPMVCWGSARDDVLLLKYKQDDYKRMLGLSEEYHYALYAPTFRDRTKNDACVDSLFGLDLNSLADTLSVKFGGKWKIITRGHQMIQEKMSRVSDSGTNVDGNEHDDMTKYLCACDVLVTDYSSSMFDILLTNKPCFLYTPDIDEYVSIDRGVYFSLDELPFEKCKNNEQLCQAILQYDDYKNMRIREEYVCHLGYPRTADSAKKTADLIVKLMELSRVQSQEYIRNIALYDTINYND